MTRVFTENKHAPVVPNQPLYRVRNADRRRYARRSHQLKTIFHVT